MPSTSPHLNTTPDPLGEFVRARRQASKMSQVELGKLAGVGTRLISELERGKVTLRMDAVNKVLRVFGKKLGYVDAPREVGNAYEGR